jgi:hypothetical protein
VCNLSMAAVAAPATVRSEWHGREGGAIDGREQARAAQATQRAGPAEKGRDSSLQGWPSSHGRQLLVRVAARWWWSLVISARADVKENQRAGCQRALMRWSGRGIWCFPTVLEAGALNHVRTSDAELARATHGSCDDGRGEFKGRLVVRRQKCTSVFPLLSRAM